MGTLQLTVLVGRRVDSKGRGPQGRKLSPQNRSHHTVDQTLGLPRTNHSWELDRAMSSLNLENSQTGMGRRQGSRKRRIWWLTYSQIWQQENQSYGSVLHLFSDVDPSLHIYIFLARLHDTHTTHTGDLQKMKKVVGLISTFHKANIGNISHKIQIFGLMPNSFK